MLGYVYRFKNRRNEVIYVGYTNNMNRRMHEHFTRGHLPQPCYDSVAAIEYKQYNTKSDAAVMEIYYINTYQPIYNTRSKMHEPISLNIIDDDNWKVYMEMDPKPIKVSLWWFSPILFAVLLAIGIVLCLFL